MAYWVNHDLATRLQPSFCCINTAVEATTLDDRACGSLLPQDRFILEQMREDDALVVSGASLIHTSVSSASWRRWVLSCTILPCA